MATDLIVPDNNTPIAVTERANAALERMRARLASLDPKDFSPLNVDIPLAVNRALGVRPATDALRARIERECPGVDMVAIDEIEDRAYACAAANTAYDAAVTPQPGFATVAQEAFDARGVLQALAKLLISCNLLKAEQLEGLKGTHGYREVGEDCALLVLVLRQNWSRLEGKVPVTETQLSRVQGIADRLREMVGVRDQAPERTQGAADLRARAFTLLDRAYDEVRRAIAFLRWHEEDVDVIAPPLRTHVGPRPKAADKEPDVAPTTAPATPAKKDDVVTVRREDAPVNAPASSGLPKSDPYGRE